MAVTASKLRDNVYRILDQVLDTGIPVEVVRRNRKLKIIPDGEPAEAKLHNLKARPKAIRGNPEDLVHLD